jgi:hypothetical protein
MVPEQKPGVERFLCFNGLPTLTHLADDGMPFVRGRNGTREKIELISYVDYADAKH